MAISKDNSRIIITIPDRLKSNTEFLSVMDKRTVSKELEYIIERYFDELENRFPIEAYDEYYEDIYYPKQLSEKIVNWLTSVKNTPNRETSPFHTVFKDENIDQKAIDLVASNKKIDEHKYKFFTECLKTLNSNKKE
ncbi:hypothetical protein [Clostridium botulinum]|uniref:hypothetical protein n=1 Tax=Clostridium botulinum TaxID=1491 RepID=UPI001C9B22EF|nr:hypothetical protein [Clostridium botulinum]MBY6838846.1 hypothetical protein [Clostridium botulinum]